MRALKLSDFNADISGNIGANQRWLKSFINHLNSLEGL